MERNNGVFSRITSYCSDIMATGESGRHPAFPRGLTRLFKVYYLFGSAFYTVPAPQGIVEDVVEIIFAGCREKVPELKVVERTSVVEICVAEFIEIVDAGWIVGLNTKG